MADQLRIFSEKAKGLSRNPLGIIALFIVLVYGFASLVTAFAGSFTPVERLHLIYFLILFPVLVLTVFAWLVSKHSERLFAPSDFRDEENYVKMQMAVVASLGAATAKDKSTVSESQIKKIVEIARAIDPARPEAEGDDGRRNHILWVDDVPENNIYERQAFDAAGIRVTLALSTNDAFERLASNRYAAIISDMGRREGPREGYVLLDSLRQQGDLTPLFFYASSSLPEHRRETREHGGQGCTNNAQELFELVTKAL